MFDFTARSWILLSICLKLAILGHIRHIRHIGHIKKQPELKPDFKDLLIQLEENPFQQRLKLHQLQGRHKEKYSVSLTYSYRVVLYLEIINQEITLLEIGSHDEVY